MKKVAFKWTNARVFLLSVGIAFLVLLTLGFTGLLQKPLAVHAAWVYVLTHHPEHLPLSCTGVEYVKYFGWKVAFQEADGYIRYIGLRWDNFPVLVQWDTFRPLEDPFYESPE